MSEDLLFYAQLGHADHIARLIKEGADPDWCREDGVTTLMLAAFTGRTEIVAALLDHGATIDHRAPDGMTALLAGTSYAATTRDISCVELLVARGASTTLCNDEGNDALMIAARNGLVELVILMLKAGANPRAKNRYGSTALMQAARGHMVETVLILLRAGADRSQRDDQGLTAADYARDGGTPPPELAILSAADTIGPPPGSERQVTKFEHADFKMSLLGAWTEGLVDGTWEYLELAGERQIDVRVDGRVGEDDDQSERLTDAVRKEQRRLSEATGSCTFSEVRVVRARDTVQARFYGSEDASGVFFAVAIYAAPDKTLCMTYRDFRSAIGYEARSRQASESVASFRVR